MFMNWIVTYIRNQFPDAPVIDTDKVKEVIENVDKEVFLIDCRRPDEYAVSKIPGATNLHFKCDDKDIKDVLESNGVNQQTLVINYCSLGYRSAIMTKRIKDTIEADPNLNQGMILSYFCFKLLYIPTFGFQFSH